MPNKHKRNLFTFTSFKNKSKFASLAMGTILSVDFVFIGFFLVGLLKSMSATGDGSTYKNLFFFYEMDETYF